MVTLLPQVKRWRLISSRPPASKRTVSEPSVFFLTRCPGCVHRSGPGGEPFGVDQRLEVRLDALEGFATLRCAQFGGELAQQCGALLESGAFECGGGGAELRQFLGRDGDEAAKRPGAQPPVAFRFVRFHRFERPERCLDRVAKSLCRASTYPEVVPDVIESEPAVRRLQADGQADNVR